MSKEKHELVTKSLIEEYRTKLNLVEETRREYKSLLYTMVFVFTVLVGGSLYVLNPSIIIQFVMIGLIVVNIHLFIKTHSLQYEDIELKNDFYTEYDKNKEYIKMYEDIIEDNQEVNEKIVDNNYFFGVNTLLFGVIVASVFVPSVVSVCLLIGSVVGFVLTLVNYIF